MKSNDIKNKDEIRALMQKAVKDNDPEAFTSALNDMVMRIGADMREEYEQRITDLQQEMDSRALTARGVRQLTSEEHSYYQKLIEAMKAPEPRQAVANMDVTLPRTVINSVFEDLQTNHPLLSKINFIPASGTVEMVVNVNGHQEAVWGDLTAEIVKELSSGFKKIETNLLKLSAFLLVSKPMLELGPEWMDNFVRQVLYEALANGLEAGIVAGDGNKKPIGMNRLVGDGVTVTGGVYPVKAKIKITDLSPETIGNLLSLIAVGPNGTSRQVRDVLFIVNPQDYFQKVMPATTLMAPDGSYRNDVMPYPMTVLQSHALDRGDAILGIGYRYLALAGTAKEGRIEYSDHSHFLEDMRAYLVKAYANGMPMDNNAFLHLDISGLRAATWKIEQVTAPAVSTDATLADLRIGSLTMSPAFAAATTAYTADTTNATNTLTAFPSDAGAVIEVLVNDDEIDNGSAATWKTGENTVTVNVTAADGSTKKTYTVTVTKS